MSEVWGIWVGKRLVARRTSYGAAEFEAERQRFIWGPRKRSVRFGLLALGGT
jgi:hypothetical protein